MSLPWVVHQPPLALSTVGVGSGSFADCHKPLIFGNSLCRVHVVTVSPLVKVGFVSMTTVLALVALTGGLSYLGLAGSSAMT